MERNCSGRGFTRTECIVTVVTLGVAALILAGVILPGLGVARQSSRQLRDSSNVRGIHQAMIVFCQSNADRYPLPSEMDADNTTVPERGAAKNTTANLYSMLAWNGSIPTEMLVSPAEVNPRITVARKYVYDNPAAAVVPAKALWDPSFAADFAAGKSHASYAHLELSLPRRGAWKNSCSPQDAILGNRGPRIGCVRFDESGTAWPEMDLQSLTLLIHGSRVKWEGNVAFNDNHVEFLAGPRYRRKPEAGREDVIFYDEPDDAESANAYLGIFIKAGERPAEFSAIWD